MGVWDDALGCCGEIVWFRGVRGVQGVFEVVDHGGVAARHVVRGDGGRTRGNVRFDVEVKTVDYGGAEGAGSRPGGVGGAKGTPEEIGELAARGVRGEVLVGGGGATEGEEDFLAVGFLAGDDVRADVRALGVEFGGVAGGVGVNVCPARVSFGSESVTSVVERDGGSLPKFEPGSSSPD